MRSVLIDWPLEDFLCSGVTSGALCFSSNSSQDIEVSSISLRFRLNTLDLSEHGSSQHSLVSTYCQGCRICSRRTDCSSNDTAQTLHMKELCIGEREEDTSIRQ